MNATEDHNRGQSPIYCSQYINRFHKRSGHLWQNRFFSCVLDEVHMLRALAYVERNPVRAKLVRTPWQYAWSSAAAHAGETQASELLDLAEWRRMWVSRPDRWRKALREREDEELAGRLRLSTHTGRPLATDSLLSKLEHKLGRRLRPLPVGRPKKARKTERRKRTDRK
jgi:putative transposase